MEPLVTIVAISYNQEMYVEATLNSIKLQTYSNIQLIISDDGSADRTKQIIRDWVQINYPSATFLDHPTNLGIPRNLNSTIPFIKGDFIKIIGCDDVMLPDTVSIIMHKFKQLPDDYGVIYANMWRIDETGELIDEIGLVEKRGHEVYTGYVYKEMIRKPFITQASMIFKREVLDKLQCFNEKVYYDDHDTYLRAAKYFKFYYIPEKLVKYRVHSGSTINSHSRIKYFHNTYFVYYSNYDRRPDYREIFIERLLFCIKNFYVLKFRNVSSFSLKAFLKTGRFEFVKFAIGGIPLLFTGRVN